MKLAVLAAAMAVALSTAAQADPFAPAYGNTVTQIAPDGSKTIMYVNPDMTWERHQADGTVMKGTFMWKDDQTVCFTIVDPAPKQADQATGCNPIKGQHNVGDTWTDTDPKGNKYTMSITAGR
jgi:hypothetical protein